MRAETLILGLIGVLPLCGCTTYLAKPGAVGEVPHVVKCDMGGEATAYWGVALYGWFVHHNCVNKWESRGYTVHGEPECAYIRDDEGNRVKIRSACEKNPPDWAKGMDGKPAY
jgi:hypothetical protein